MQVDKIDGVIGFVYWNANKKRKTQKVVVFYYKDLVSTIANVTIFYLTINYTQYRLNKMHLYPKLREIKSRTLTRRCICEYGFQLMHSKLWK